MNAPEWFQDPRIKNISPDKLAFLLKLAEQIEGKNQKQAMPILIGAVSSASRARQRSGRWMTRFKKRRK